MLYVKDTAIKKQRNAEATQQAIVEAAKHQFVTKGFDQVGVREIAAEAGVDAAMVNRYFGSKEGLFKAAVIPQFNIDALFEHGIDKFSELASQASLAPNPPDKADFDPSIAFLMSIGSSVVGPHIAEAVDRDVVGALAQRVGGKDAVIPASMIIALLTGFNALHHVAKLDALTHVDQKELSLRLKELIDHILNSHRQKPTGAAAGDGSDVP